MPLTTTQAQTALKAVNFQLNSLNPDTLITLFEIDATDLASDAGLADNDSTIFRFHNNMKLNGTSIWWGADPNPYEYVAAPVFAEGFEVTGRGTLPTPKLAISVQADGINLLGVLKNRIRQLGDLVGAKVTRIRTFAAYLNSRNFLPANAPDGFTPDSTRELPRDVYYIDRKSAESKSAIEWELASVLDVEGIRLPLRRVLSKSCQFDYRGEGCNYEFDSRRDSDIHNSAAFLPLSAPPVATVNDELIATLISPNQMVDLGAWSSDKNYHIGHYIYREKNGIKRYFTCKVAHKNQPPPNRDYWYADVCSKSCVGCRLRWKNIGQGHLPFGGFPSANRTK